MAQDEGAGAHRERKSPERPPARRTSINITPAEALEFSNRLAYDDQFRTQLQSNPAEALAQYNIFVPEDDLPNEIALPAKEDLQRAVGKAVLDRDLELAAVPAFLAFVSFVAFFSK